MKRLSIGLITAFALLAAGIRIQGSSHREALTVLNEPCADNTDTFAWVSDGSHSALYLVRDCSPRHEPGQELAVEGIEDAALLFPVRQGRLGGRRAEPRLRRSRGQVQVALLDHVISLEREAADDRALELAHVARPGAGEQGPDRARCQARRKPGGCVRITAGPRSG